MRRSLALPALALATLVAGAAHGQADPYGYGPPAPRREFSRPYADPGAVIAAEIAFNQLARRKGQWTAFRQTAAEGAIMFNPARVLARDWLRDRADPPAPIAWQPHAVWVSCDGSYAVTRGAWQGGSQGGVFVTVWQRQKGGDYKWVLDSGEPRAQPPAAPEMIAGKVAECPRAGPDGPGGAGVPGDPPRRDKPRVAPLPDPAAGRSDDGSLRWTASIDARGAGTLVVGVRAGGGYREVLREAFAGGA